MSVDIQALLAQMQQPPAQEMPAPPTDPMMSELGQAAPMDPMLAGAPAPLAPGAGMGGAGAFPSVMPDAIAQTVQAAIEQMMDQDQQMLSMQQQQAAVMAQPIIDQMLGLGGAPEPMGDPAAMDPMMAFGEGPMPPMPPEMMMG